MAATSLLSVMCAFIAVNAAACGADSKKLAEGVIYLDDYGDKIVLAEGWNPLLKDDSFTVFLDRASFGIRVQDSLTGVNWYSNPPDGANDPLANPETKDQMNAQFRLTYYDTGGNLLSMNSYSDSVARNQASVHKIKDGFEVHYKLGEFKLTLKDIPSRLSGKRFQDALLDKLSDENGENLKTYYKFYESEDLWSITGAGRNHVQEIYDLLQRAGYTIDDLNYDNAEFGVAEKQAVDPEFDISLQYSLGRDGLIVRIPNNHIQYSKFYSLYDIDLFEYFGAANDENAGYLFVPDGSGALIDFSRQDMVRDMFQMSVYGTDQALREKTDIYGVQQVRMPIFGMKKDAAAFLGVITEGEASASVKAYRAGRNNSYYCVYPSFRIANKESIHVGDRGTTTSVPAFESRSYSGDYTVQYMLLPEADAGYTEMAAHYREYLSGQGLMGEALDPNEKLPLFVETIGGVVGFKEFLGFSYIGLKTVTAYEENIQILEDLKSRGVGTVSLRLAGWFNKGLLHTYPKKIALDSELGGRSAFDKLTAYCRDNGIGLYPLVNLLTAKRGNGFAPVNNGVRALDRDEITVPDYISPATMEQAVGYGVKEYESYIVSPAALPGLTSSFLKAYDKLQINGLSPGNMGAFLYSDFVESGMVSRVLVQRLMTEQLDAISNRDIDLLLDGGNQYAMQHASAVVRAPDDYSYFDIETCAVPFFQMVYRGYAYMAGAPLNLSSDRQTDFLRAVEGGTSVYFQLGWRDPSTLKNTENFENFASGYHNWAEYMTECYLQLAEIYSLSEGSAITRHETVSEGVNCTTYENGLKVFVNYGDKPVALQEATVEALSFTVISEKGA